MNEDIKKDFCMWILSAANMGVTHLVVNAVMISVVFGADRYHRENKEDALKSYRLNPGEDTAQYWYNEADEGIKSRLANDAKSTNKVARNVVMFMGDGMSVPTLAAARTLLGQRNGQTGEEGRLFFEKFPTVGLTKTYCITSQIPDSACTATAYLCGVKTNQGVLGLTAAVPRWDCDASTNTDNHVASITEWALADGRDAGIVTTTRITHASPAAAFAKVANRHWETDKDVKDSGFDTDRCPDIAHQLINMNPGNQFKVILGGGRTMFIPTYAVDEEGFNGTRTDDRDLIEEWKSNKQNQNASYEYIWNREQLMSLMSDPPEYLLGLFEDNHLQYNLERNLQTEPSLAELTEVAIRSLSRNEKGFFLFVEGGRIDHAHHDNYAELALDETIEMDKAVQRAAELLSDEDSLIVVTADHAHVMSFNGYTRRGGDILGVSDDRDSNGIPYMTLSYANGPGGRPHVNGIRPDVTNEADFRQLRWRSHADVPLGSETHGGDDVAVFARGPQHGMFSGLYEQSQIPHLMAYAACIGPGQHVCSSATNHHLALFTLLPALIVAFIMNRLL